MVDPPAELLAGRGVALIFEHPSALTRNSSEMAVFQLGGHPVAIRGEEIGFDRRESERYSVTPRRWTCYGVTRASAMNEFTAASISAMFSLSPARR